jgi:hypothetical protein
MLPKFFVDARSACTAILNCMNTNAFPWGVSYFDAKEWGVSSGDVIVYVDPILFIDGVDYWVDDNDGIAL